WTHRRRRRLAVRGLAAAERGESKTLRYGRATLAAEVGPGVVNRRGGPVCTCSCCRMPPSGAVKGEHEKVGHEPRPVGIGAHLAKNRRARGLARGHPRQNEEGHPAR